MEIDRHTGEIMQALDVAGIADNTILIFSSDNGPETMLTAAYSYGGQSDSGPFRGEFPSGWEGANRVPCVARWPGKIPAGRRSNEIFTATDWYSTLAHIAGAESRIPTDRPMDSIDQTPILTGKSDKSAREFAMFFYDGELLSVKWRNYKVHFRVVSDVPGAVKSAGQTTMNGARYELQYPWIFNIEDDPKELFNLNTGSGWIGVSIAKIQMQYGKGGSALLTD